MFSLSSLAFSLVLHTLVAACDPTPKDIHWSSCKQNGTVPFVCGTLQVPLDYTDPASNVTLTLELVKVSAVKQPKKGSILFNPGGPGEPGRDYVVQLADSLLINTGGSFDLIGFDTRGTENTIPFSCFANATERVANSDKTPVYLNSSDTAIGQAWAAKTTLAESCAKNGKATGELMGTGFVARDMMQIVDALKEDGLLRYWGFSYGTALGATVAAMFPDRMGRVVLDGVLNPRDYYAGYDLEQQTDTDKTWDDFFKGCLDSPDGCALAQDDTTSDGLKQKIYDLLWKFKYQPVAIGSEAATDIIDYTVIKNAITFAMYNTIFWPPLADGLHGLLTGNYTAFIQLPALFAQPPVFPNYGPEAGFGIRSSDVSLRTDNLTTLYSLIDEAYRGSELFGDFLVASALHYAQWPFKAKGAYKGDFCAKTKNPMLFVGNTFDPYTALVSARNASAGFEGSVVLEHGGHGHTSLAQPSLCTAKAIRAYFTNGTLPAPDTKCEPTFPLFSNHTALEALAPIANITNVKRAEGDGGDDDDEGELMGAVVRLGRWVLGRRGV